MTIEESVICAVRNRSKASVMSLNSSVEKWPLFLCHFSCSCGSSRGPRAVTNSLGEPSRRCFSLCHLREALVTHCNPSTRPLSLSTGDVMMAHRPTEVAWWPRPQQSCPIRRRCCWETSWTGVWTLPAPVMRGIARKTARRRKMGIVSIK